jgi:hypothetical protein
MQQRGHECDFHAILFMLYTRTMRDNLKNKVFLQKLCFKLPFEFFFHTYSAFSSATFCNDMIKQVKIQAVLNP